MPSTKELPTNDLVIADVKYSFLDSGDTICASNSSSNTSLVSKTSVIHVPQKSKPILYKTIVIPEIPKCKSRHSIKIADFLQVQPSSNSGIHQPGVVDLQGKLFRSVQDVQSMGTKKTEQSVAKVSKSSVKKVKPHKRPKTSPPLITSKNVGVLSKTPTRPQRILEYQFCRSGVVLKIPASICKEVLSILDNRSTDSLAFKYALTFDSTQNQPFSMNFEFYGNGGPDYVNIRVIIDLMENVPEEDKLFPRSAWPTTSLTMTIVDEDGHIVRGEEWTAALPNSNSGYKFEMEDFLTRTEFQKVLAKYGSLNLMMSFTHLDIIVQTEELFEIHEKIKFGRFDKKNLLQAPSPKSVELQQAVLQKEFTAFLGSQMLNRNFADGILEVRYKTDIVCFSVHRVFLAAHSPIFTSLLAESSTLIIEGFRPSVVMALLEYVYSSEVLTRDMELLTELVELSEHFQVAGLKERCHRNAHQNDVFLQSQPGQYGINMSNEYFSIGVQLQSPYFIKMAVIAFEKSHQIKREHRQETIGQESPEIEDKLQRLSLLVSMSENAENVESRVPEHASLVARFEECTVGSIYMIPKLVCDSMWDATTRIALDTDFQNENASIRIEFQKDENDGSQVCLRLIVADPDNELPQSEQDNDDEGQDEAECYTANTAKLQIGPIASAALYDKAGRVIQECHARGLSKKGPELIWEIKPFFSTTDFPLSNLADEKGELMIRVAIGYSSAGETLSQIINPVILDNDDTSKNLESSYLQNVMLNPFHHRLLAQLGNPIFADAVLHVVGSNGKKWCSISVHRIILSAFSPVLGQSLEDSSEVCLSEEDYNTECVEAVIEYMYSGNIAKMRLDLSLKLLRAAKELRVHGLSNYMLHAMLRVSLVTLQSAIRLYQFGVSIGNASVTQVSIEYFIRNKKTLVTLEPFQAFMEAHPEILHQLK